MRAHGAVALALVSGLCMAGQETVPGRTLVSPPKIDGTIDPAEWQGAAVFTGLVDPDTGVPVQEDGEFWLAYDAKYVYFAARLKDSQPQRIQATEYRTNVSLKGNDSITLQLDPFGHLGDFNSFSINPRGATGIQIAGGRAAKREWLGDIAAAGRITPTGWEAEARIPWTIMRLPAQGVHELRFNVFRDFRRMQRSYAWAFTNGGRIGNFGRWQGVRVPEGQGRTIKLLPYGYAGYDADEGVVANTGLDFRTDLTETLDLVGSINPDFRNIENQVLSLDFSYFERLAGESRPFFLEGGQFFRTSWDAPIFTSQRIGSFDAGAKLFGKLDDATDIGMLDTLDVNHENALVTKVHRRLTERSGLDIAYANWDTADLSNDALFLNYSKGFGPYNAYFQHSSTRDTEIGRGDRENAGVSYYNEGQRWDANLLRVTGNFYPRIGYAPEVDFQGFSGSTHQTRPTRRSRLIETQYGGSMAYYTRVDGSRYHERAGVDGSLTWNDGTDVDVWASADNFEEYRDRNVGVSFQRPRGDLYRHWRASYSSGQIAGYSYTNRTLDLAYRPARTLQLNGTYQIVDVVGEHHEQAIVGLNYDLTAEQSISGRLVQRDGSTNGYLSFRRSGRGADYYLIVGDPNAESFRTSVILKVAVPFELRG